jgi:serine/threonine-protein kinase
MATMQTGELIAGRYELGARLGRGGMAAVYAGTDRRLQRDVAVKLLHPEMAARPDVRRRFEAEARAAAGLAHANVVAVFDTGEHDGVPFIVMERLPGTTLADLLRDAPVDPHRVTRIAGDVLGALGAAHAAGIVHRDVKPGNILMCDDGSAKVADFGIATRVDADPTSAGHLIGTPAYLAPERLEGGAASPRSDLYSLGVVLYEALAGTKPFTGDPPLAVAHAIQQGTHAPLGEVRPDLDPRLVDAVERSMAREPGERFPSAAAMAAALEPVGDATQVLPVAPAAPMAVPAPRRNRWWAALAAVALLGTAIVAAIAAGDDAPARTRTPAPPATVASTPPTTVVPVEPTVTPSVAPDEEGDDGGKGRGKGRKGED